jgi:hypothetical protein
MFAQVQFLNESKTKSVQMEQEGATEGMLFYSLSAKFHRVRIADF